MGVLLADRRKVIHKIGQDCGFLQVCTKHLVVLLFYQLHVLESAAIYDFPYYCAKLNISKVVDLFECIQNSSLVKNF